MAEQTLTPDQIYSECIERDSQRTIKRGDLACALEAFVIGVKSAMKKVAK